MDVKSARMAGQIIQMNGALYRPSQDCSVRYGYAININKIVTLSKTDFEEVKITTILPNGEKGLLGVHTLNYEDGIIVIDKLVKKYKFR